jgi:hypothetical protein
MMCLSIYESHEHWHREGHTFVNVCTMKPYDIFNVKNDLVKSVYYAIEYIVYSLVFIGVC